MDKHGCPICPREFDTLTGRNQHIGKAHSICQYIMQELNRYDYVPKQDEFLMDIQVSRSTFNRYIPSWNWALRNATLVTYDVEECSKCGEEFDNLNGLSKHMKYTHDVNSDNSGIPFGDNYEENREKVLKRDEGCVVCGKEDDVAGRALSCHHITPRSEFYDGNELDESANDPENMVALCAEHHREYEGRYKDLNAKEFKKKVNRDDDEDKDVEESLANLGI